MAFQLGQNQQVDATVEVAETNPEKYQKRRVAIQLAYCGSGYYGLQYNVKTEERLPTIEGEIFRALKKTGLVPDDVLEEPKKMSYGTFGTKKLAKKLAKEWAKTWAKKELKMNQKKSQK